MKIKTSLAGATLVLALAGGGVALAASMADAGTPTRPVGQTAATDPPEIGAVGQTGDKPPAGVTLEKAQPAVELGATGQPGHQPPAGVVVEKGRAGTPVR